MADIAGNHRLAQTVTAHQNQVASFGDEFEQQSSLDSFAHGASGLGSGSGFADGYAAVGSVAGCHWRTVGRVCV